jgi:maltose alpha-D-glucosyltransferase/alpha-amylase
MRARRTLATGDGEIRFIPAAGFTALVEGATDDLTPNRLPGMGSNSNAILGEALFLKTFRRLRMGLNPEVEVGAFLTEVAQFPNCVPVAGHMEFVDRNGAVMTLAMLQSYVPNQGDVWTYAVEELTRQLQASLTAPAAASTPRTPAPSTAEGTPAEAVSTTSAIPIITSAEPGATVEGFRPLARTLGQRTAQLHAALALRTGDPAFDPEPVTQADVAGWAERIREDLAETIAQLRAHTEALPPSLQPVAGMVLAAEPELRSRIDAWSRHPAAGVKSRIHGSYHLDQVMLVENDVVIMDLEGEQGVPLSEARRKTSPLRDVASMLRSFDYARRAAMDQATQHEGDLERLAPAARAWVDSTRQAFLESYRDEAIATGQYRDLRAFDADWSFIAMFELQKAMQELRFELDHRPDWAGIPLRGLASMIG